MISIVVFWLSEEHCCSKSFKDGELSLALEYANSLRKQGFKHVCLSTENSECVTKKGVDSVVDGKTPSGENYDWSKKSRGHPGVH